MTRSLNGTALGVRLEREPLLDVPPGLAGVVVAETAVGDVRGREGFYHYGPYSAVDLAETRTFEDVWYLLVHGELPGRVEAARFAKEVRALRSIPEPVLPLLAPIARASGDHPLEALRSAVSLTAAALGFRPWVDAGVEALRADTLRLSAVTPTLVMALHRLRHGLEPIPPRPDLGYAEGYLYLLTGEEPEPELARALERYLITTIDHGFNASTFTARVVTSTGADAGAALTAAIGALSGPLHGGAPSRALDMLDEIGTPDRAAEWVRRAVREGRRIMGFGHRVYKTEDPRSVLLRRLAGELGGPRVELARAVERTVVDVLAELKPGRDLYTNVEFYAGVLMERCGLPPELFTPTFTASRTVGWSAHVVEQAAHNRIIRPSARYTGPPPPRPVPLPSAQHDPIP